MQRCFVFVAALLVVDITSAAEPLKVAQRWALLIGVDDYAYAQKLKYCGADQRALQQQLIAAGFPKNHVFLLEDKAEDARLRPSLGNIERHVELVLNLAEAGDLVVISFSGHGMHHDGKSYLCPNECALDNPATLVSVDRIYEQLRNCAAQFKLVLVDACRNDPRPGGTRAMTATEGTRALARSLQEIKLPEGVVLLNSCAPGEVSWEDEEFGHGVFMHYVLDGLRGAADTSNDGSVSLNELQSYAGTNTKTYIANRHRVAQRPFFKGDLTTEALEYALLPVAAGTGAAPTRPTPRDGRPANEKTLINSLGMKLELLPAGEFEMGAEESADAVLRRFPGTEADWIDGERPAHRVRLTKPFYIGQCEVTLGEFLEFYHDAKYRTTSETDGKGGTGYASGGVEDLNKHRRDFVPWSWGFAGQTMRHPVVNVSWDDAAAFCAWLSKKENCVYRLPTEAEWEYACRAGAKTRFSFGDDPQSLVESENIGDSTYVDGLFVESFRKQQRPGLVPKPNAEQEWKTNFYTKVNVIRGYDGYFYTAPVGSFKPNAFGLYDMHGNAGEWCGDWYDKSYYTVSPTEDPTGPATGTERVNRGGFWFGMQVYARSAHRSSSEPGTVACAYGFRVVRER